MKIILCLKLCNPIDSDDVFVISIFRYRHLLVGVKLILPSNKSFEKSAHIVLREKLPGTRESIVFVNRFLGSAVIIS